MKLIKAVLITVAVLLIGTGVGFAADRADEVGAYPPEQYCRYIGGLYFYGVQRHNAGAPNVYKPWPGSDENPVEPTADDALYIRDWNGMTSHEKKFISEHITKGWKYAESLAPRGKSKTTVDPSAAAYIYYDDCLKQKALEYGKKHGKEHKMLKPGRGDAPLLEVDVRPGLGIMKVGSTKPLTEQEASDLVMSQSEMLDPAHVKALACKERQQDATWVIRVVRRGVSKDRFWADKPLPENWSDEEKKVATAIVDGAYLWPRGEQDYVDQVGRDCLAEKTGKRK